LIGIALLGIAFKDLVSGDWQSVANSLLTNLNPYDFTPVMGCFSACHISGKNASLVLIENCILKNGSVQRFSGYL